MVWTGGSSGDLDMTKISRFSHAKSGGRKRGPWLVSGGGNRTGQRCFWPGGEFLSNRGRPRLGAGSTWAKSTGINRRDAHPVRDEIIDRAARAGGTRPAPRRKGPIGKGSGRRHPRPAGHGGAFLGALVSELPAGNGPVRGLPSIHHAKPPRPAPPHHHLPQCARA